jgi:hypothetical protein
LIEAPPTAVRALISRLTIASTYHLYADIINSHEKMPSPPVVDLISPWLITDNAHTTSLNNGLIRILQIPGLSISDEYKLRYAIAAAVDLLL